MKLRTVSREKLIMPVLLDSFCDAVVWGLLVELMLEIADLSVLVLLRQDSELSLKEKNRLFD